MINASEFTKRLQTIMTEYELTASAFAEKIEVGRSSISHLISGRNKPSLEIILKILEEFPMVEFDWLVRGKGKFETEPQSKPSEDLKRHKNSEEQFINSDRANKRSTPSISEKPDLKPTSNLDAGVSKIVIFYDDGHFEIYRNN